jgi:hypothetical protein
MMIYTPEYFSTTEYSEYLASLSHPCNCRQVASARSIDAEIVHVVDSLSFNNNKSIMPTVLDCHLHGWRRHCMSVLREMKVLQMLVQQTNDDNDDSKDKTKQSPPTRTCIHQFRRLRYRFKCERIASSQIETLFPVACDQIQSDSRQGESRSIERILVAVVECTSHNSSKKGNSCHDTRTAKLR